MDFFLKFYLFFPEDIYMLLLKYLIQLLYKITRYFMNYLDESVKVYKSFDILHIN